MHALHNNKTNFHLTLYPQRFEELLEYLFQVSTVIQTMLNNLVSN